MTPLGQLQLKQQQGSPGNIRLTAIAFASAEVSADQHADAHAPDGATTKRRQHEVHTLPGNHEKSWGTCSPSQFKRISIRQRLGGRIN